MIINQVIKIHDPDLISVNTEDDSIELEKINDTKEIQQKKEAEIEIIITMLEKGLINHFQTNANT